MPMTQKERRANKRVCLDKTCGCNREGKCICLEDTNFDGKPCPFFKTHEQFMSEYFAGRERLQKLGVLEYYNDKYSIEPPAKRRYHKKPEVLY